MAHVGPEHTGLEILYHCSLERRIVDHLVASLMSLPAHSSLSLVPTINAYLDGATQL